jgi:hypothetical protein
LLETASEPFLLEALAKRDEALKIAALDKATAESTVPKSSWELQLTRKLLASLMNILDSLIVVAQRLASLYKITCHSLALCGTCPRLVICEEALQLLVIAQCHESLPLRQLAAGWR